MNWGDWWLLRVIMQSITDHYINFPLCGKQATWDKNSNKRSDKSCYENNKSHKAEEGSQTRGSLLDPEAAIQQQEGARQALSGIRWEAKEQNNGWKGRLIYLVTLFIKLQGAGYSVIRRRSPQRWQHPSATPVSAREHLRWVETGVLPQFLGSLCVWAEYGIQNSAETRLSWNTAYTRSCVVQRGFVTRWDIFGLASNETQLGAAISISEISLYYAYTYVLHIFLLG